MKRSLMKRIVAVSYTGKNLEQKKVLRFASYLNRAELKTYIQRLREEEKKRSVFVTLPFRSGARYKTLLQHIFPKKEIVFRTNQELIVGVKIIDNDMVYEANLKSTLEEITEYLTKQYD